MLMLATFYKNILLYISFLSLFLSIRIFRSISIKLKLQNTHIYSKQTVSNYNDFWANQSESCHSHCSTRANIHVCTSDRTQNDLKHLKNNNKQEILLE